MMQQRGRDAIGRFAEDGSRPQAARVEGWAVHRRPAAERRGESLGDAGAAGAPDGGLAHIQQLVEILAIEGLRILVREMEAINATPILDVKPALDSVVER
jgi:hypothetical protein